ncbi:MAG: S8 family serine peptidase, partial [Herbinix sp.]|nr:S8 family serine peptidase [Herbinix sp.]
YSDSQWYINNPGYYMDFSTTYKRKTRSGAGIDMDVENAWKTMEDTGAAKREVIIAIIDTGIDYTHPDLSKNIWINEEEISGDKKDNDNNGYIDDVYGWDFYNKDSSICHYEDNGQYLTASLKDNDNHGTHIAGIIAAVANNNIGIAGVASNIDIKLMTLKINGGADGSGLMSDAIEAVKYATMMGADICNLSWGTDVYSDGLEAVMKESDMLFVAAAGNSDTDNDEEPIYPASSKLDNLISVASVDSFGELSSYSNYGAKTVDLAAPGNNIYSTIVGGYAAMSGSSMAAPQVTAVAALLYAYNDQIYASNVKDIIIDTISPILGLEGLVKYAGIPNAYQAVMSSAKLVEDTSSPELTFKTIYKKNVMTVPVDAKDPGASKIRVIKWIYGKKSVKDFKHGVNGTLVEDNKVSIAKEGTYTFYASDYSGNESVFTYKVAADTTAPQLNVSFSIADNYKIRTVIVKASDGQSGLKRIKYMPGIKYAKDFLPAGSGKDISLKSGEGTFDVKIDGIYTVFVSDNRGNVTVKTIIVKTIKATVLNFTNSKKTMAIGEQYSLRPEIKPFGSTDRIIYTSSNNQVASVTATGKITAIAEGTTYITAKTSSGLKAIVIIKVNSDG